MKIYSFQNCLFKIAYRNKYDMFANDVVKEIFSHIKTSLTSLTVTKDDLLVRINIESVDSLKDTTYKNFHLTAYLDAPESPIDTPSTTPSTTPLEIIINLFINKNFSSSDYQDLNYSLYNIVRHETEHYHNHSIGKRPDDDYVQTYQTLINSNGRDNLEKHVRLVSKYILSDTEIDSYARSVIYVAKKQKKAPFEVIDQIFKRAFFNNSKELLLIGQNDANIMQVINNTKSKLMKQIGSFYPKFKEKYL